MFDKAIEVFLEDYEIDIEALYRDYEEIVDKAKDEWLKNCIKDVSDYSLVYLMVFMEYIDKEIRVMMDWVYNIDTIESDTEVIRVNIIEPTHVLSANDWLKGDIYYEKTKEITEVERLKYYKKFPLIIHRFEDVVGQLVNELEEGVLD